MIAIDHDVIIIVAAVGDAIFFSPFHWFPLYQLHRNFALPNCRPDVISAVLASLSARSFPFRCAQDSRSPEVFVALDCAWLCVSWGSNDSNLHFRNPQWFIWR